MNLTNSFFSRFFTIAALLLNSVFAAGQQFVRVTDNRQRPVEDAVVVYQPVQLKSVSKVAITDASGKAELNGGTKVMLSISKIGHTTVIDSLEVNESKTISIGASNINLKDVVVTGQFEPVTADKSVQKVRVIDRKRIEQQGAVSLKDLLSNELNIRLSQDAVLGTQMSLTGLGGQNVKILVDGVPVIGRMDGNIDISQLNLNNIERIEIIEGPMSVIYGTDALGGVINLITKKTSARQYTLGINSYYENVGTYNADANAGFRYKDVQVAVSGGRNFFDGYSETESDEVRWMQWKPREQYFADGQVRYKMGKQSHRVQGQWFEEKITNRNRPVVTPYSVTGFDDYFYTTRLGGSLFSDLVFNNKATLSLINSYSFFERRKNAYVKNLVTGNDQLTPNPEDHDTTTFHLWLSRGTYTTNTSSIYNSQLGYDINIETGTGKRLEHQTQQIGDYAVFYISDIRPLSRLTIRQGLRFIYNTRYGAPVIPSFNLKYDITDQWVFRASYARGFRAPSLKELSLFFVDVNHNIRGNESLKAESSNNYSGGLTYTTRYKKLNIKAEGNVFYNDISDLISLAVIDPAIQLYNYVNIDEFKTMGGNLTLDVQYANLMVNGGYSRTGRYNQLSATTDASEFSFSDEYRANATYGFKKIGTDVSLFYKYNGAVPGYMLDANGNLNSTMVQAYAMLDASVTKAFFSNFFSITVGAKNLTDVKNISYNSGGGGTHTASTGNMAVAMGTYYFTSIRINIVKNQKTI